MSVENKALFDALKTAQDAQDADGSSNPLAAVTFIEDDSFISKVFTPWITLAAGQKYYTEATLLEWGGNEHLSVGVEIKPTDPSSIPADHPQKTP